MDRRRSGRDAGGDHGGIACGRSLRRVCPRHAASRNCLSRGSATGRTQSCGILGGELRQRGLARPSEDGVSIPLHPEVRTTILVILGQLARRAGDRRGMAVHPATDYPKAATDLLGALSRESMPSCDGVIRLDLEPVTLDLSSIPLDESVPTPGGASGGAQSYMRSLRGFLVELGQISDPVEREAALLERTQEIADMAHDNRRSVRRSVGKSLTSWSMGIAGGVWSAATGRHPGRYGGRPGLAAGLVPGVGGHGGRVLVSLCRKPCLRTKGGVVNEPSAGVPRGGCVHSTYPSCRLSGNGGRTPLAGAPTAAPLTAWPFLLAADGAAWVQTSGSGRAGYTDRTTLT